MNPRLVIGYGNTLRGDDAAGPAVVRRLEGRPGLTTMIVSELVPELAEAIAAAGLVVFVDASETAEEVECIRLVPSKVQPVGHSSDPGYLLALAEVLYSAHPLAWLVAVPARGFQLGAGISPRTQRFILEATRLTESLCMNYPC
jgi:hydrogenase maturation protease